MLTYVSYTNNYLPSGWSIPFEEPILSRPLRPPYLSFVQPGDQNLPAIEDVQGPSDFLFDAIALDKLSLPG